MRERKIEGELGNESRDYPMYGAIIVPCPTRREVRPVSIPHTGSHLETKHHITMDPKLLIPNPLDSAMNLHPMFVHFPVALLPVALAFLLLARWRNSGSLLFTAKACLIAGAIGALAAVISGLIAEDSITHNEVIHRMMETHEAAAITLFSATAILAVWSRWITLERRGSFRWFAGTLILLNGLLVGVGDLGARMVYQQGAGVIPAAPMIEGHSPEPNGEDDQEH